MTRAPLLQLSDIGLGYGRTPLFERVDLVVNEGDRLALVGRNGSGKSTLLKVIAGLVEPDSGRLTHTPGQAVGYLEQDPDMSGFATLGDFAEAGIAPEQQYRVAQYADGLKVDMAIPTAVASGGQKRRAALAQLMARDPEILLLDEPTNHLDIEAILWLEDLLKSTSCAVIVISHDRAFLSAVSRETLWLDRGVLRRSSRPFEQFERWQEETFAAEDLARHKLDRKIKSEARWAVEGISARRRRNQGRLRALRDLRAERAAQIRRKGTADLAIEAGKTSGKRVIDAVGLTKAFGDAVICRDFSIKIARGDRVAFVGPNGIGKTTMVEMLIGRQQPDAGDVTLGTNLEIAVFDQSRAALDPDATLWESLTDQKESRISGRADQIMVRGTPRHVVGYLQDFLFDESQARAPIRSLSGGEKARLLLARLMALPSNLLVLDEPTNDLDVETLDLLQEVVSDFAGTVLLISHDRDFIDRIATQTIVFEGRGRVTRYAGGWSDYLSQRGDVTPGSVAPIRPGRRTKPAPDTPKQRQSGLSFTEEHRLNELPGQIERVEAEIARLSAYLSNAEVYANEPAKAAKATTMLSERQKALEELEAEWLLLEEKAASE